MIRLHVTAEGPTEQNFVKKVLALHLGEHSVYADARSVLTSKNKRLAKEYCGGLLSYEKAKKDILTWMKEDRDPACRFTTMFDLYALPVDFPSYSKAQGQSDPYQRVEALETALSDDIGDHRFVPYIQLHEFEALIFSDPQKLDCEYMEHEAPIRKLVTLAAQSNPELINDGRETAPSKRILAEIPEYDKVSAGVSITEKIGLVTLRNRCRHFNDWVTRLERLGEQP